MAHPFLEVGAVVRHPQAPEWGLGQVQSIIGDRVTVNFENEGKIVLQASEIPFEIISFDEF